MTWTPYTPRHLDTTRAADSGACAAYWPLMRGAHSKKAAMRDVWAGNPDTDKFWSKEHSASTERTPLP